MTLKRNPAPTDKAGEKKLYRELVLATPEDSYLRTVLNESREFIFGNIDNDIAWPVQERVRYVDANIEASKAKLAELKSQIAASEKHLKSVRSETYREESRFHETVSKTTEFLESIESVKSCLRAATRNVETSKKDAWAA